MKVGNGVAMRIYALKITDIHKDDLQKLYLCVSLENRSRIERLINKKDRIRTLIGEILIRKIFSEEILIQEEISIQNEDLVFQKNQYGKPYLKDYQNFHFNISHSGDIVVCATHNMPVGIDIERIREIDEYLRIAEDYFTEHEKNYITKNTDHMLSRFYEIWTLKESYIKCLGKGLSIPLKSFSISINNEIITVITERIDNGVITVITEYRNNEYLFKRFAVEQDYMIAACSINNDYEEIPDYIIWVNQNNLIKRFLNR
jgi:4'-phosphopantetheinyl transferase